MSVSLYFAVFIACLLVLDHTGMAIFALFCAAFHEAGHILTIFILKVSVSEINFKLFGINIKLKSNATLSYKQEIIISMSGCIANLMLCIIALIAVKLNFYSFHSNIIFLFSLIIAGFNIIPIAPLDGGRALEAYLISHMQYQSAEKISSIMSFIFIIPLGATGFFLLFKTGYNFSLVVAALYLSASLILKRSMFFKKQAKSH